MPSGHELRRHRGLDRHGGGSHRPEQHPPVSTTTRATAICPPTVITDAAISTARSRPRRSTTRPTTPSPSWHRPGPAGAGTTFATRAQNWQNVFNPGSGFLQPKESAGDFEPGFSPTSSIAFVEANAYIYTAMVPFDVQGVIEAEGGDAAWVGYLNGLTSSVSAGGRRRSRWATTVVRHSLGVRLRRRPGRHARGGARDPGPALHRYARGAGRQRRPGGHEFLVRVVGPGRLSGNAGFGPTGARQSAVQRHRHPSGRRPHRHRNGRRPRPTTPPMSRA